MNASLNIEMKARTEEQLQGQLDLQYLNELERTHTALTEDFDALHSLHQDLNEEYDQLNENFVDLAKEHADSIQNYSLLFRNHKDRWVRRSGDK